MDIGWYFALMAAGYGAIVSGLLTLLAWMVLRELKEDES